jgi:hypothetical protein
MKDQIVVVESEEIEDGPFFDLIEKTRHYYRIQEDARYGNFWMDMCLALPVSQRAAMIHTPTSEQPEEFRLLDTAENATSAVYEYYIDRVKKAKPTTPIGKWSRLALLAELRSDFDFEAMPVVLRGLAEQRAEADLSEATQRARARLAAD